MTVEELTIQRCVDGELDDESQQALLAQLEHEPGGWRSLALAFLECQVWSRELLGPLTAVDSVSRPSSQPRRMPVWLAVAASALMGVGCGFLINAFSSRPGESRPVVDSGAADTPTGHDSESSAAPTIPQPVFDVELADGDESRWRLPVYRESDLTPELWDAVELLTPEARQALSEQGYFIRDARQLYTIPLEDGRTIAVPVDTVHVRYGGI